MSVRCRSNEWWRFWCASANEQMVVEMPIAWHGIKNVEERAAVTMYLATSSCNPAYQERRSITHALLRAAVPGHHIDQCSRSVRSADSFTNPGLLRTPQFKPSSRCSLVRIFPTSSSMFRAPHVFSIGKMRACAPNDLTQKVPSYWIVHVCMQYSDRRLCVSGCAVEVPKQSLVCVRPPAHPNCGVLAEKGHESMEFAA